MFMGVIETPYLFLNKLIEGLNLGAYPDLFIRQVILLPWGQ